ncbi:ABC-2 family transporter protein [Patescibacteria group bacterium]|nr:ABC-2 family transporter protein [Patescibacteria group bacterium]
MFSIWKKYKRLFVNSWQATLAFRANFFVQLIMRGLGFLIIIFLWKAVYAQSGDIGGFTFKELLTYFLIVEIFRHFMSHETFRDIQEDVRDGRIANWLVLPLNSMYVYFANNLARNIVALFFYIVPVALIILFTDYFVGPANGWYFLMTVGMGIIGLFSSMFLYTLFGSMAFWTVETGSIIWAVNFIVMFFAGKMIPVQFFPDLLRAVIENSPLVVIFNLPASLYLGKFTYQEAVWQFVIQIGWMIMIYIILAWVWRRGVKKLELVGG